jgi:hypothetical protein
MLFQLSHGDIMPAPKMQKVQCCLHEHWKNCLDFLKAHMFVQCPAEPEEDDDDIYASPEESYCTAQLVSSICVQATKDAGPTTGRLEVT